MALEIRAASPLGKASSHSTALPTLFSPPPPLPVCSVFDSKPPAVRPTPLRQLDMESLTRAQICLYGIEILSVKKYNESGDSYGRDCIKKPPEMIVITTGERLKA